MGVNVVELNNVTKSYQLGETQVAALRKISLAVEEGEFMAIMGPSGSGKTTLLNLIGCLDEPTSGEVYVQNHNVGHLPDGEATKIRRDTIGFIFQSFNLIPVLNVIENVEFPLILQKRPAVERLRRVSEIVHLVGLGKHTDHKPDQLSGGQRQRVAIARALVTEPVIVLADEPTANLDSETGHAIIELMFEMNQKKNVTFIFSTHDQQIMNYATRRVVLRGGIIESDESVIDSPTSNITYHHFSDVTAAISSGSHKTEGMVVVPCSMNTSGAIAAGISGNLIHRAADVCIKENRRLVLVPRETPLSSIHLENMLKLSRLGVCILPAMPGFYHKPHTMDEQVDFIVCKILDQFGIENNLIRRWE